MKFEKQTYTQVPNSLFALMKDMDECELKVVMLICRYTFGYHREEFKLSTRRIAAEIGMNTASVQKGADSAIERGIIEKYVDGNKTTLWRAVVSDSEIESQVIQKLNCGVSENESLLGVKENKRNKETKNTGAEAPKPPKPPKASQIPEVVLFREVTKRYPPSVNNDDVVSSVQAMEKRLGHPITADELLPFYKAWCRKGYKPVNLAWLEWAETGVIPENGTWKSQKFSTDGLAQYFGGKNG